MPTNTSNSNSNSRSKLSTIITWLLYLVPIYIFLIAPALRTLYPQQQQQQQHANLGNNWIYYENEDEKDEHNWIAGFNITDDDDSFISPDNDETELRRLNCRDDDYRGVHIFSRSPLIVYIEGFFTDGEADHLVSVSEQKWSPSILYDGITSRVDLSIRRSDRALLDRDNVVRCAEERARSFQGWRPFVYIERMWSQRYNTSGHYRHHYDWMGSAQSRGGDRLSTFMVYLAADCTGGGTNFPRLRMPPRGRWRWCRFIECDDDGHENDNDNENDNGSGNESRDKVQGVTFKPIKGNAIYWENLRPDGTGYPETWHAALPVLSGTKIGLNIWSWYQAPVRKDGVV